MNCAISGLPTRPASLPNLPAAITTPPGRRPPTISWPASSRTASPSTSPSWPTNWLAVWTSSVPAPPSPLTSRSASQTAPPLAMQPHRRTLAARFLTSSLVARRRLSHAHPYRRRSLPQNRRRHLRPQRHHLESLLPPARRHRTTRPARHPLHRRFVALWPSFHRRPPRHPFPIPTRLHRLGRRPPRRPRRPRQGQDRTPLRHLSETAPHHPSLPTPHPIQ